MRKPYDNPRRRHGRNIRRRDARYVQNPEIENLPCMRCEVGENMNIFDLPELPLSEELITVIAESGNVRIERIISTGQISADWYDQDETEFVALLDGKAVVEFENGESISMSKGDTLLIKPHERHRVSFTSSEPPCVWLCVFH